MAFSTPAELCLERAVDIKDNSEQYLSENIEEIFDIEKTALWMLENNFQKVCLQFPDDLLGASVRVCRALKDRSRKDVCILADTTYNSCCVDQVAARHAQGDAIVHYGHSCLSAVSLPVFYVFPKRPVDVAAAVHSLRQIETQSLIVFYDVSLQYVKGELCSVLYEAFPHLRIGVIPEAGGAGAALGRAILDREGRVHPADVLTDSHLVFIGCEGPTLFNLAVCSKAERLHYLDCRSSALSLYTQSAWFKRRRYLVEKCKDSGSVGLLVCTLSVRNYGRILRRAKKLVKASGKKCYTLTVGKPNVAKLANLSEIETFVLIACPENELYSSKEFLSPVIYPYELELALNQNRDQYELNYSTDFNDLLEEGRNYRNAEVNGGRPPPDMSLISGSIRNMEESETNHWDESGRQLDGYRKEDWAVKELGIGKAIGDRSWKGLEQNLGESKAEMAAIGRKGIASGYQGESF